VSFLCSATNTASISTANPSNLTFCLIYCLSFSFSTEESEHMDNPISQERQGPGYLVDKGASPLLR